VKPVDDTPVAVLAERVSRPRRHARGRGAKVGGMSMSLTMLAAEGEEHLRELPMPAYMYAVIALIAFALLLAVTWAFRGTAAKLGQPKGQHGAGQQGHGGHH